MTTVPWFRSKSIGRVLLNSEVNRTVFTKLHLILLSHELHVHRTSCPFLLSDFTQSAIVAPFCGARITFFTCLIARVHINSLSAALSPEVFHGEVDMREVTLCVDLAISFTACPSAVAVH